MKNSYQHLHHIIQTFGIDVSDFYTITFTEYEISLQGHQSSSKMAKYDEFFKFELDKHNYLKAESKLDGFRVTITLT